MASPFPGMNPYLEQRSVWEDFHQSFITEIRESIASHIANETPIPAIDLTIKSSLLDFSIFQAGY